MMMAYEGGRWVIRYTPIPDETRDYYPTPTLKNDVAAVRIRKLKKRGTLECGTMWLPTPVLQEDEENDAPYFPMILVCYSSETDYLFQVSPILDYENKADDVLQSFTEELIKKGYRPLTIRARDKRTYSLLCDLCSKTGISLKLEENLPDLENVMQEIHYNMGKEEDDGSDLEHLEQICDMLSNLRDGELKQMPPRMVEALLELAREGFIPEDLAKRLKSICKTRG